MAHFASSVLCARTRGARPVGRGVAAGVAVLCLLVATDLGAQPTDGSSEQPPNDEKASGPSPSGKDTSETSTSSGGESFEELVQQGKVHFTKGNYEKARSAFEEAHAVKESPNLLFNIGLAAEKSGDLEAALEYYKKFVVSPDVTLKLREKAQKRIDVLEPIVEDQTSNEEKAETERPEELQEKSDELASAEASDDESADDEESDSEGDQSDDEEPAGSDAIDEQDGGSPAAGWLLTGAGVASIGGGVVFTLMSQQAKQRFNTASRAPARRAARDAAWRNQWIADGLFVVGLGTAVGGTVLLLNHGKTETSEESATLVPALGPDFAGLKFRTDF